MIVSKFGGTAIADASGLARLVQIIGGCRDQRPVVVVSALPGVANALVALETSPSPAADLASIADRHRTLATELELPSAELGRIETDLAALTRRLATRAWTSADWARIEIRASLWSSRLVVAALRQAGLPADWVDAQHFLITKDQLGIGPVPDRAEIARRSARFLGPLLTSGRIPVVPGAIGATPDGQPVSLGPGGSAYTATLLAAGLDAERVEIWSGLPGILTADPDLVPTAQPIADLSYEEAADLAAFGAGLVHRSSHLPLIDKRIPCLIRNPSEAERPGTRIGVESSQCSESRVKAVVCRWDQVLIAVKAPGHTDSGDFSRSAIGVLSRHGARAGVAASSQQAISVTLDRKDCRPSLLGELDQLGRVTRAEGRALVALIGRELRGVPGLARRLFGAIDQVNMEVIAHGAADSHMILIVKEEDAAEVVRRLHWEFLSPLSSGLNPTFAGGPGSRRPAAVIA
jgi:aspartate kinase